MAYLFISIKRRQKEERHWYKYQTKSLAFAYESSGARPTSPHSLQPATRSIFLKISTSVHSKMAYHSRLFWLIAAMITLAINLATADILDPLPRRAATIDLKYQPVMDFDKDCCYNTAAVNANGTTNAGLDPVSSHISDCHDRSRISHSNTYSRHMCNHGWCAMIYAYYFEMDPLNIAWEKGHRHEWEHVVVWFADNAVAYVSTSEHGNFNVHRASNVRFQGCRPKIVYHKDGLGTRVMRLAAPEDDNVENHNKKWFTSHLVDWCGFPSEDVRHNLVTKDWGAAHMGFADDAIGPLLLKSMPKEAKHAKFDCFHDDGLHNF